MVKLIAKSPFAGALPQPLGNITISEVPIEALHSLSPFKGQEEAVSVVLRAQFGCALPQIGGSGQTEKARIFWAGRGTWMITALPKLEGLAAVTDQSDAWASLCIEGPSVLEVLARLVPIDLRIKAFPVGQVARTLLGHMNVIIQRTGDERFDIMGFRSLAGTMLHELERAAKGVGPDG